MAALHWRVIFSSSADHKHIFIECSCLLDFHVIWLKLYWVVEGLVKRIFKWDCEFSPLVESPITPVWTRFQGLPLYMFDEMPLLNISNAIGKPICIDTRNLDRSLLSSARVCVELDISKPQTDAIWIGIKDDNTVILVDGFWVYVYYDVLPSYCSCCQHIGHTEIMCKRKKVEGMVRHPSVGAQQELANGRSQNVEHGNSSKTVDISVSSHMVRLPTVSLQPQLNAIENRKVNLVKAIDDSVVLENLPSFCSICKHKGHASCMCNRRKAEVLVRQVSDGAEQANCEVFSSTVESGNSVTVQLPNASSWHTVGKKIAGPYSKQIAVNALQTDTLVSNSFNCISEAENHEQDTNERKQLSSVAVLTSQEVAPKPEYTVSSVSVNQSIKEQLEPTVSTNESPAENKALLESIDAVARYSEISPKGTDQSCKQDRQEEKSVQMHKTGDSRECNITRHQNENKAAKNNRLSSEQQESNFSRR